MENIQINIVDVIALIEATDIAFKKKMYTVEEFEKYFPHWNNLYTSIEKFKRHVEMNKLYSNNN